MSNLKPVREHQGTVLGAAALIVAIAALVVALIGVAGAASTRVIVRKGDIAPGAVTSKALAKGSVTARKLRGGAVTAPKISKGAVTAPKLAAAGVTSEAIASDAVTAAQLAPGSVYGGALGAETLVTKPIADLDVTEHNGEWTASNAEAALCGEGERLLGTGFAFTNPGNRQVAWLQVLPIVSGGSQQGVTGRITSDSGGSATAEVAAVCLK